MTLSAIITLFLIMDPLGNVPLFLSVLRGVPAARRRAVLVREVLLAYVVLLVFLVAGGSVTRYLHLQQESLSIAGGIVLFLIALRMIFPSEHGLIGDTIDGEPFLVPLAIPLFAGPSTLAALLLLRSTLSLGGLFSAMTIAWAASAAILLASTFFYRVLRERGLMAMERLMGMLLVMVAVQMLMDGLKVVLAR
ncbi:MAG TPA: MarC family protein [Vicinamibacterales bacterium]|jgi:multiple antibiotic resistance protein|nr:MarC family protein [Vicinamibacterales bacterium]